MLPQSHRLPGYRFPKAAKSKIIYHHPFFALKLVRQPKSQSPSRIGFIVSKKIAKQAVARNRIKRLLRQAFNFYLPRLQPGYDFLILTKPAIVDQSLINIQSATHSVLSHTKLLLNENPNS